MHAANPLFHAQIFSLCTDNNLHRDIVLRRSERDKYRKCIYLVNQIIHFRQNFCKLKVRSSLVFFLPF